MTRRGALVLPAAALAVHQLRYWLAFGADARHELFAQGHAYLHTITPWIVLATCVAAGAFLGRAAHAWRGGAVDRSTTLFRLWVAASGSLVAIYVGQEVLEGLLASGHPAGIAGVLGGGGFWAVPAALWIGGLVALALRGAEAVLACITRHATARAVPRRGTLQPRRPPLVVLSPVAVLATAAAGRAPPAGQSFPN